MHDTLLRRMFLIPIIRYCFDGIHTEQCMMVMAVDAK